MGREARARQQRGEAGKGNPTTPKIRTKGIDQRRVDHLLTLDNVATIRFSDGRTYLMDPTGQLHRADRLMKEALQERAQVKV